MLKVNATLGISFFPLFSLVFLEMFIPIEHCALLYIVYYALCIMRYALESTAYPISAVHLYIYITLCLYTWYIYLYTNMFVGICTRSKSETFSLGTDVVSDVVLNKPILFLF